MINAKMGTIVILLVLILYSIFEIYRGFKTRRMHFGMKTAKKPENKLLFWIYFGFYIFFIVFFIALITAILAVE